MVKPLLDAGVSPRVIDLLPPEREVSYRGLYGIEAVEVPHNVQNCGYKLRLGAERMFYCTDCATLDGVSAEGYDLYMLEANRTEAEFDAAIAAKREAGLFAYEEAARRNHLSREQAEAWLAQNAAPHSRYVFLHQHGGAI